MTNTTAADERIDLPNDWKLRLRDDGEWVIVHPEAGPVGRMSFGREFAAALTPRTSQGAVEVAKALQQIRGGLAAGNWFLNGGKMGKVHRRKQDTVLHKDIAEAWKALEYLESQRALDAGAPRVGDAAA